MEIGTGPQDLYIEGQSLADKESVTVLHEKIITITNFKASGASCTLTRIKLHTLQDVCLIQLAAINLQNLRPSVFCSDLTSASRLWAMFTLEWTTNTEDFTNESIVVISRLR